MHPYWWLYILLMEDILHQLRYMKPKKPKMRYHPSTGAGFLPSIVVQCNIRRNQAKILRTCMWIQIVQPPITRPTRTLCVYDHATSFSLIVNLKESTSCLLQISKNQLTVSHEEMPGPKRKKYKTSGEYFRPTSSAVAVALNSMSWVMQQ